jgi:ABC-type nickel/cobalt efflux system permease component RcnA
VRRLAIGIAVAFVFVAPAARAHPLGQRPVLQLSENAGTVNALWVIALDEGPVLTRHLGLGPIRPETLHEHDEFHTYMLERFRISADGAGCAGSVLAVSRVPTGYAIPLVFDCGEDTARLRIRLTLLHDVDERYQTLYAMPIGSDVARGVFTVASPVAEIDLRAGEAVQPSGEPSPSQEPRALLGRITASLQGQAGAAPLALALVFALALGALHALTPGHGKTLTAAYVVGSGGTVRHGMLLGGVVALAHAAGTAVIGAMAIAANRLLLPSEVGPWLEVATGALILAIAATLVRARPHLHLDAPAPGKGRLAVVGLIGGLVPSPDAIAVVLVAFSLERWTAGVALIAAFSIGLAIVVLAVAVIAARGGDVIRRVAGERFVRYAPRIAAVVFVVLGIAVLLNGIRKL